MPSLLKTGRIITATGFIALSILQFFAHDWLVGRPDNPVWLKGIWLLTGLVFLALALGMLFLPKRARISCFLAGCFIFAFSFLIGHVPQMLHKDLAGILWQLNAYKTLALAGGCWIVAAAVPGSPYWLSSKILVVTGWITMALWLIIAGAAHIKFNGFVQQFIPEYIPARAFWSYFTAVALMAGGVGLLINPLRQWAALLSGLMILLWFFLLHIPRVASNPGDISEWLGVCESFAFAGMLFVLASLSKKQTS